MPHQLKISIGQHSDKGKKEINQDFHGALIPREPHLTSKGIVVALSDGVSSSGVSQAASEATIKSLLDDYYCTSDSWSVKKSAQQVLMAINSWLYSQTQQSPYRYDKEKGYVCTLSTLIVKSTTAHLFHVGDARIYRLLGQSLEQLTQDHRIQVSQEQSHLSRALGVHSQLDIDYRSLPVEVGDTFVLATDGVYEFVNGSMIASAIADHSTDFNAAARRIVDEALSNGSDDNLTVQIVRVEELPESEADELLQNATHLPLPPLLSARMEFDGYTIVREIHASSRSHLYLAIDGRSPTPIVIKTPSIDLQHDPIYLERFLMEDWIARRINSAHVLKACEQTRKRNFVYVTTEFIDGQTLTQWMIDHPKPSLQSVRDIVEQIAKGLLAFHRMEMLHQDLRPENIMIDKAGTVKIIDFGSTLVAGVAEMKSQQDRHNLLGTPQYTAPEYFLGETGTPQSDQFSLGVIAYQMLSGQLPYGAEVAKTRTRDAQRGLSYRSLLDDNRDVPAWIDGVLKRAVHPIPAKRYEELSEFVYDLHHPNETYLNQTRAPLIERNPVGFWKGVSLVLALIVVALLFK